MSGIGTTLGNMLPTSFSYLFTSTKDDIQDLQVGRKTYRNVFRVAVTIGGVVFFVLLPNTISPHFVGGGLNTIVSTLSSINNAATLEVLSAGISGILGGSASSWIGKQTFRLWSWWHHGDTNTDHYFDDKRYDAIVDLYQDTYPNVNKVLLKQKVKEDIAYMMKNIHNRKSLEATLDRLKANGKINALTGQMPIDDKRMLSDQQYRNISKLDFKIMLWFYIGGDDSMFNTHIETYPKIKQLVTRKYAEDGLQLASFMQQLEAQNPNLVNADQTKKVQDSVRRLSQIQVNGVLKPTPPAAPSGEAKIPAPNPDNHYTILMDDFKSNNDQKEARIDIPTKGTAAEQRPLIHRQTEKEALLFLKKYLPKAVHGKYRDSFSLAKDLHKELASLIPKLAEDAERHAKEAGRAANAQKRRKSI